MKYNVAITGIGSYVEEMASENQCIILYNDTILDQDLKDISVTHSVSKLHADVAVGDQLTIGESTHTVTAIGGVALDTLRELGHCTLRFGGLERANLPGEIHVTGTPPALKTGDEIRFA